MTNTKLILLSLVLVVFAALFIGAFTVFGTGTVKVYGDEYVTKYFQRDKVMQVNIQIDEADWNHMMANSTAEEFVTATVVINGDVYSSVQIRPKGNSSLMSVAGSDSNRYSFKINFNDIVENQTMAGLTQLNLNNCFSDPSYMREYLSYQIFEEMGVAVPAFSYAAVSVNGDYFGLYLAVESILEPFLERNFGDISGDLYKSMGNTLKYNGDNPSDYSGLEVKSTLKNADWSKLIKMLEVLNNGGDIEKYLDVEAALKYIAVNTALVNFDSYLGNFGHNYYLYEQNGVFTIIPWDLNMSFGGFGFGSDTSRLYIDEPTQGALADRPLVAKLLANEKYLQAYHGYLEQITTKYLSGGYLEAETDRLYILISKYVRTDPTAFFSYEQFEQSISGTDTGSPVEDKETVRVIEGRQEKENEDPARNGFPVNRKWGFGNNAPGILKLAADVSDAIQKQLAGELHSTNNGNGMGMGRGMPMGDMPGNNATGPPGQQRPGGNVDMREREGGERPPGGMALPPRGVGREAIEALGQEIRQAGELTGELRNKAEKLGIPNDMLEMMARSREQIMFGGMGPPEGDDGNRPMGMGRQQQSPVDKNALTRLLAVSGVLITVGITIALLFKRRRYYKA
ncbi:Inner spore coat protein H [Sporotomaculum syntrophicum]|uniref:Inner spore coat protein H n=1 Tax=Sporotomaculum syntrophicum TaxID=182264 RepID=A0A9D3AW95_9FIRM|nr:CotH kinase family protein [Sporotomaculum syntrophicum]KAF1085150.1 Inner spore coat protein H [Sporotomaculum syntrophicum]